MVIPNIKLGNNKRVIPTPQLKFMNLIRQSVTPSYQLPVLLVLLVVAFRNNNAPYAKIYPRSTNGKVHSALFDHCLLSSPGQSILHQYYKANPDTFIACTTGNNCTRYGIRFRNCALGTLLLICTFVLPRPHFFERYCRGFSLIVFYYSFLSIQGYLWSKEANRGGIFYDLNFSTFYSFVQVILLYLEIFLREYFTVLALLNERRNA